MFVSIHIYPSTCLYPFDGARGAGGGGGGLFIYMRIFMYTSMFNLNSYMAQSSVLQCWFTIERVAGLIVQFQSYGTL